MRGDGTVALELQRSMQEFAYIVRRHVVAEERDEDALQQLGSWGPDGRRELAADHEREVEAVFNVEYYGSHLAMAQDAACIAEALHEALLHEEDFALPPPSARE